MADDRAAGKAARRLIEESRGVLFDFDGPVCRLFPKGASAPLADELRGLVAKYGAGDVLTDEERESPDPHVVLRAVHRARRERAVRELPALLEEHLTAGEVTAAETAWPTELADTLVRRLTDRGHRLAIVTNNSAEAARRYLSRAGLLDRFEMIEGRTTNPALMKPDPDVIFRALDGLGLGPTDAVMIGDSGSDFQAARRAGVSFVGYGRNERKIRGLRAAGASIVVDSYRAVLQRE
ncbi:HAD family hydrolase [Streptomyces sp. NPDC001480]|uniref:HAD family hydrolase n=1 Tax=Streptomyces sp. NPDC001480 TaxID=3364577 RepID=UPI0036C5A4DC